MNEDHFLLSPTENDLILQVFGASNVYLILVPAQQRMESAQLLADSSL